MKSYRFTTSVNEDGTIKLPEIAKQIGRGKEVEVIIMEKKKGSTGALSAKSFLKKWQGFLKDRETDDARYQYLMEKHK